MPRILHFSASFIIVCSRATSIIVLCLFNHVADKIMDESSVIEWSSSETSVVLYKKTKSPQAANRLEYIDLDASSMKTMTTIQMDTESPLPNMSRCKRS